MGSSWCRTLCGSLILSSCMIQQLRRSRQRKHSADRRYNATAGFLRKRKILFLQIVHEKPCFRSSLIESKPKDACSIFDQGAGNKSYAFAADAWLLVIAQGSVRRKRHKFARSRNYFRYRVSSVTILKRRWSRFILRFGSNGREWWLGGLHITLTAKLKLEIYISSGCAGRYNNVISLRGRNGGKTLERVQSTLGDHTCLEFLPQNTYINVQYHGNIFLPLS